MFMWSSEMFFAFNTIFSLDYLPSSGQRLPFYFVLLSRMNIRIVEKLFCEHMQVLTFLCGPS